MLPCAELNCPAFFRADASLWLFRTPGNFGCSHTMLGKGELSGGLKLCLHRHNAVIFLLDLSHILGGST